MIRRNKTRNPTARAILSGGAWVFRNTGPWFFLFTVQLVLAFILVVPFAARWSSMLDHSLMGDDLLGGHGANLVFEFLAKKSDTVSMEVSLLVLLGLFYLVLSVFFNAGILGCLVKNKDNDLRLFFENGGRYFLRFLGLTAISVPCLLGALFVQSLLGTLFHLVPSDSERLQTVFLLVRTFGFAVLILSVNMVFDYAKIIAIVKNRNSTWKNLTSAFRFVLRNPGKTYCLYGTVGIFGLVLTAVYLVVAKSVGVSAGILLLLVWQQLYAFFRVGMRLLSFSAQWFLYQRL